MLNVAPDAVSTEHAVIQLHFPVIQFQLTDLVLKTVHAYRIIVQMENARLIPVVSAKCTSNVNQDTVKMDIVVFKLRRHKYL